MRRRMRAKVLLATAVAAVLIGGAFIGRILLGASRIQGGGNDDEFAEDRDEDKALHMLKGQTTKRALPAVSVVPAEQTQQQEQQHVPDEEGEAAALEAAQQSAGGDHDGFLETKGLDGGVAVSGTRGSSGSSSSSRVGTTKGEKEGSAPTSKGAMLKDTESQQEGGAGGKAQVPLAAPHAGVLESVKSTYKDISEEILARWGAKYADTALFSGGMAFSDGGTVVENKILNAVVEQGGFLAAFTGISTTAGHDCLFEESYPIVLNGTLGRLMAAAGVRFEAINVAMGNTRPSPYSLCVDAHAGLDADIIGWDMGMMVANRECGPAARSLELFIRSASVLPRHPAVLVTDATPDQDACTSGHLAWVTKRNKAFLGCDEEHNLMNVYRDFGLHQIAPSTVVPTVTCGDERFARGTLYNSTEKDYPHPMRWHAGPSGHLLLADILFMHYAEVFLSAMSRLEGVAPGVTGAELREKGSASRTDLRTSLGGLMGVGGATEGVVATGGGHGGEGDEGGGGGYMGAGRGSILPPPAWCAGSNFCEASGNYRCATTFFPLAGKEGSRLLDMVSSEGTRRVLNLDRKEHMTAPTEGHWAVTLNEEAPNLLAYLKLTPPEGTHHPIDMKWVLVGEKESGPIEFEFETLGVPPGRRLDGVGEEGVAKEEEEGRGDITINAENNSTGSSGGGGAVEEEEKKAALLREFRRVVVCKPDFVEHADLTDAEGVRFSVDGVETPAVQLDHFGMKQDSCVALEPEIGAGRHTLTVEPLKSGEPYVAISHVVYPA